MTIIIFNLARLNLVSDSVSAGVRMVVGPRNKGEKIKATLAGQKVKRWVVLTRVLR